MESNYLRYDFKKSFERIDKILESNDNNYEEKSEIPPRDDLTYTNGFYVDISSIFVDIRNSSSLTLKHRRPKLAKIYRSYISEVVAIMNSDSTCIEINIIGDCVSGIFNSKTKDDINDLFWIAFTTSSLIDVLNCKLEKNEIEPIEVGIGISYGRALMVQAGYSGSGINDVVWMGDVVNEASKLANYGNKSYFDYEIMVSQIIFHNLNQGNQSLLTWNQNRQCYHGSVVNVAMNEWYNENCKTN